MEQQQQQCRYVENIIDKLINVIPDEELCLTPFD